MITIKGRKYILALDSLGHFNYFATRAYKQWVFAGRFASGQTSSTEIEKIHTLSSSGFFMMFRTYFVF